MPEEITPQMIAAGEAAAAALYDAHLKAALNDGPPVDDIPSVVVIYQAMRAEALKS